MVANKSNGSWESEWVGMPEFVMEDQSSFRKLVIHFDSQECVDDFAHRIGQDISPKQSSLWYPPKEPRRYADKRYVAESSMNPKYPIYVVTKGRWDSRLTVKALEHLDIPYRIVVEMDEYENYASVVNPDNILILPPQYLEDYNTCDELGMSKSVGPGAARNFCWDHAKENGHEYHWVMDDNIAAFGRINRNLYVHVTSGHIFRCAEDFVDRYTNLAVAGFNYDFFAKTRTKIPPYYLNTRVYSCLLIRNAISHRWRGRYNEDTDLCLRVLKDGYCTIEFNAFIQEKATTQTLQGGNTDAFYASEGTLPKSQMLADLHPDVAEVVWRFNRWHHHVNYRPFKNNKLMRGEGVVIPEGIANYGMSLVTVAKEDHRR